MPKPLQYRSGSLIYFQGDPADKVFLVHTGRVNLAYQDIETGEDVHDMIQTGEFFGVKSALGRYPREENSIALQDTTLMAFTVPEFEALAMANTRMIMKMLKVFSNQLRKVHKQVSSLMENEEQDPEAGLFSVGEYYFKSKNRAHARYIFNRYLTYYPSGRNASVAANNLQQIEPALTRASPQFVKKAHVPYGEVLSVESADTDSFPASSASSVSDMTDTAKAYYDAVSLMSQQKYQQAYIAFKKIADSDGDPEYAAKSSFELGSCLFLTNKYEDCISYYTKMITAYPKHPDLADALFYMGQSYEKSGKKDQAMVFYKKILSMSEETDGGTHMKAKRALKALAG